MSNTILFVEDETSQMQVVRTKLEGAGYEVLTASDGEEGLQMALEQHPDLIVADLLMPKMGGMSMIKKLREDDWGKSAKVLILSNLSDKQIDAVEQGVYDYLVKSDTSLDDVVKKVNEILKTYD